MFGTCRASTAMCWSPCRRFSIKETLLHVMGALGLLFLNIGSVRHSTPLKGAASAPDTSRRQMVRCLAESKKRRSSSSRLQPRPQAPAASRNTGTSPPSLVDADVTALALGNFAAASAKHTRHLSHGTGYRLQPSGADVNRDWRLDGWLTCGMLQNGCTCSI